MEPSILTSVKKVLGIAEAYTAFDPDILMHINAAFSILNQLGVGPIEGFFIEDEDAEWEDFGVPANQLNLVRTYIFLKVRSIFDPPTTSFLITAVTEQIKEYEWRLNAFREDLIPVLTVPIEETIYDY